MYNGYRNNAFTEYRGQNNLCTGNSLFYGVEQCGDGKKWKQAIIQCRKNPIIKMITAASFASPLLERLGVSSFACHVWGGAGIGKTLALMLGMSVWGNPAPGVLVNSFVDAGRGGRPPAPGLGCLPVAIDEFNPFNMEGYAHELGGASCRKGNREHNRRVFLFAGEESFEMARGFERHEYSVFDIFCECLFNDVKETRGVTLENYGHAGREFLGILDGASGLAEKFESLKCAILARYGGRNIRAAALAAILLADRFVTELVLKDDNPLTLEEIEPWISPAMYAGRARALCGSRGKALCNA